MVRGGLAFFAVLFSGLLLFQTFTPVMTGAKKDPSKNPTLPSTLNIPADADEGIEVSPNPSPVPESMNVGRPRANFNGLATWTFNTSNYVFDESLTDSDFYGSIWILDSWTSFRSLFSRMFQFATTFSTVPASPRCTSANPCRITMKPEGRRHVRRPDEERGLALNNCGKSGDTKFTEFEFKHILRTTTDFWDPNNFGLYAFSAAHWRRGDSPYSHATFFFVPKLEVIDYTLVHTDNGEAQCKAQSHYDAWTCVKTGSNEDVYGGCYFSGKCRPTYRKSDGHFLGLDCLENSGNPSKDFIADPYHLGIIQDLFVSTNNEYNRPPPKKWQIDEVHWRVDKRKATGAGLQFTEPRPEPYQTDREALYNAYTEWLLRHPTEKMAAEVRRLFYRQPYFIFGSTIRKTGAPNEGFVERKMYNLVVNPMFVPDPDPAKIQVPFIWSGNRGRISTAEKNADAPEWDLTPFQNKKEDYVPDDKPPEVVDAQVTVSKLDDVTDELAAKLEDLQKQ
jgi:hypothetical protein